MCPSANGIYKVSSYSVCAPKPVLVCSQMLWRVMYNYHQIKLWHERSRRQAGERGAEWRRGEEGERRLELDSDRIYVRQKLERGLTSVWRVRVHQSKGPTSALEVTQREGMGESL